jgi:acetyltransferase-like isoleucine patch superfamily enzyme
MKTMQRINPPQSIYIGYHTWICESVRVLKGAYIGHDSVVGMGSIVTNKKFEPNSLITGIPAKVVKTNINWRPEIC